MNDVSEEDDKTLFELYNAILHHSILWKWSITMF